MIVLRRRDQERHMARVYRLALQWALRLTAPDGGAPQSLPPPCDLIREWGRIGSPGTVRVDSFATAAEAEAAGAKLAAVKRRKGYRGERYTAGKGG